MAAETIHITIAGKVFPVKVSNRAEGEKYLLAAGLVEEKMEKYASNFNTRQSTDLMAMCLLEFAFQQVNWQNTQTELSRQVSDLTAMVQQVL